MIVIADTSPINYLVLIRQIHLLPLLYRRILIPVAVQRELQHPKTPDIVREWIQNIPEWMEVRAVEPTSDPALSQLDKGEAEAISLAQKTKADRIIIDESFGRRIAESQGLQVIGTLGILREAANRGHLNLEHQVVRLKTHGFHVAQRILDDIISKA